MSNYIILFTELITKGTIAVKVSAVLLCIFIFVSGLAQFLFPHGPYKQDILSRFAPATLSSPLGRDYLGRDIFTRIVYGGRISLSTGFIVTLVASLIGVVVGSISGYRGGVVDEVLLRLTDILLSLPPLIFPMVIIATLGPELKNAVIAMIIVYIAPYIRLVRGDVRNLKSVQYIEASIAIGASGNRIMFRHLLPNIIAPILVRITLDIGRVIRTLAMLSFLGLGAQPPTPEWGLMTATGRNYLQYWWYSLSPGFAIFIVSFCIAIIGDAMNDTLNRQKQ